MAVSTDTVTYQSAVAEHDGCSFARGMVGYCGIYITITEIINPIDGEVETRYNDGNWSYLEAWLENTVQDSKLARRLYKNQIKEIKEGKIWLK
jgi:hypothetical protein